MPNNFFSPYYINFKHYTTYYFRVFIFFDKIVSKVLSQPLDFFNPFSLKLVLFWHPFSILSIFVLNLCNPLLTACA